MATDPALSSFTAFLEWCKSSTEGTTQDAFKHLSGKKIPKSALSGHQWCSDDLPVIKLALRSLRDIEIHMESRRIQNELDVMTRNEADPVAGGTASSGLVHAAWSDACRWMVVLNTVCVTETSYGETLMIASLHIIPRTIASVGWLPDVRRWTARHRGLIPMLIRHWINEDTYVHDHTLEWNTRHFALAIERHFQYIEDHNTHELADAGLLNAFSRAVDDGGKTITRTALQQLFTMLQLKNPDFRVACLCLQLVLYFSKTVPSLRPYLLQQGIIRAATQFLALLTAHPPTYGIAPPLQQFILFSVTIYGTYLQTANGPTVIVRALDEGILVGFLKVLPWLFWFGTEIYTTMSDAFFEALLPFLTYRSVLRSLATPLRRVEALHLDADITSKCEAWTIFSLLASQGLNRKARYDEMRAKALDPGCYNCENHDCKLRSEGTECRRCAGCSTVMYCSSSCHKEDWPRHRVICKALQKQLSEGKQLPISPHDRSFIHYLIVVDMDRYCSQLRETAKKEFPSVPLSSLFVQMTYILGGPPLVKLSVVDNYPWDDDERPEIEGFLLRAREKEGQRTLVSAAVREGFSNDVGPRARHFPFLLFHSENWLDKQPSSWGEPPP